MTRSIAVAGDACVDIFSYCSIKSLAPDLPIPVVELVEELKNPGMAANVSRNLEDLNLKVDFFGPQNWENSSKTRFIDVKSNHHFIRVDKEQVVERINQDNIESLLTYELVVISDYDKGFLKEEDLLQICERHPNVLLDTKKILGEWALGAHLLKLNTREFEASSNFITKFLFDRTIVTLGEEGARFQGQTYPTKANSTFDLSGAGDAFFAGLVFGLANGMNVRESIRLGNETGTFSVSRRGISGLKEFWSWKSEEH